jgi:methyl-accepting chemotaxis protein
MNAKKAGNAPRRNASSRKVFTPAATAYKNKVSDLLGFQRKAIDDTAHAIEAANDRSNMLLMILTVLMVIIGSWRPGSSRVRSPCR